MLLADLTCGHAERLFGRDGHEVVKQAWGAVKVLPAQAKLWEAFCPGMNCEGTIDS